MKLISDTNNFDKDYFLSLGGREWTQHGHDRVYITCDVLNKFLTEIGEGTVNYGERNNRIFFDAQENAVMRSYKQKKPSVVVNLNDIECNDNAQND